MLERVYTNNVTIVPKLSHFQFIYLGLNWLGMQLVFTVLLFQPFLSLIIIKRIQIIPSSLMHYFYLQCSPSCKHFDQKHVKCLLSLLESPAPASSVTNFKLTWMMASLLVPVTTKCCSDLTLLHIHNQHLFLQCLAAIFSCIWW